MTETARPIVVIHDVSTGEVIEREMNDAEYAQHLLDVQNETDRQKAAQEAEESAAVLKASALAKLTALGLSEEEAKAIAG